MPRDITWNTDESGLVDAAGAGTGFTLTQPSTKGLYLPARLNVNQAAGTLRITATRGLQIKADNTLDNGLGVGVRSAGSRVTATASLVDPSAGTAKYEQAGIWFGPTQDDYVKVVVVSAGSGKSKVQMLREMAGISRGYTTSTATNDEYNSTAMLLSSSVVTLTLVADAFAGTVTGRYAVGAGAPVTLGSFTMPASSFDGSLLQANAAAAGVSGLAGIFASTRNNPNPIDFTFANFAVNVVLPDWAPPAAPQQLVAAPTGDGSAIALSWAANSEVDLAGYEVYRSTAAPVATTGTPLSGIAPLTGTSFTDTTAEAGITYSYVAVAKDANGNASPASSTAAATRPLPPAQNGLNLKVDFTVPAGLPVAGYVRDSGEPFDGRTGSNQGTGNTFGWIDPETNSPLNLTLNGRSRTTSATTDPKQKTLMHMQYTAATGGTPIPGAWELAVPSGLYTVTVGVGEGAAYYDSVHHLNIENQNAIAAFTPIRSLRFASATRTVWVDDGRLTLSATGGVNTKITYADIASAAAQTPPRPRVTTASPSNASTAVLRDGGVTTELLLPNGGLAAATVNSSTVRLTRATDGAVVAANVNTSGGGDVVALTPADALAPATWYRFEITTGVQDVTGQPMLPWSHVFKTGGDSGGGGLAGVAFDKVATTATGQMYTSVVVGPDHRLYAGTIDGTIWRFPINGDGTLGAGTAINTIPARAGGMRTVLGMVFDPASTPTTPILWVTDNAPYLGVDNVPDWEGKVVRLSGADLQTAQDWVVGLPRSNRDHESNSLAFGPDGALYLTQGSNTAMGAPDAAWGNRPERLLSAAVLRINLAAMPSTLPLDVKTEAGGTYDPRAAGAAVTLYATGLRNAFDLVWHSNGELYVPTNGSAAGGNMPGTPATLPSSCATRIDAQLYGTYSGPSVPPVNGNKEAEPDWLFRVHAGGYYGHPAPVRCEWVLNGGNPTENVDPHQVSQYPVGTATDRNYRVNDVYDLGVHASADGVIEYRGDAFGGVLRGRLLVVRYSVGDDIVALDTNGTGGSIVARNTGIVGMTGFNDPLDLIEDTTNGNIYVSELGASKITLLRPRI